MARERKKLKAGEATGFVKARLKRLPRRDETWEADFRALPGPLSQSGTHYLGLVVVRAEGSVLAEEPVGLRPDVNDLAALLAGAMRRPRTGRGRRPKRVRVRKNPLWPELFPHLREVGVEVTVNSDLGSISTAYHDYLRRLREARRARMVPPTAEQEAVERLFPAVAQWLRNGYIEVGEEEGFGFVTRALGYGGLVFEDDRPETLAEALAALEVGLRKWFAEQGIEVDEPG